MLPALSSESEPDCNSPSGVVLSLGFLVKNPGLIGKKVALVDCSFTAVSCAVTFALDTDGTSVSLACRHKLEEYSPTMSQHPPQKRDRYFQFENNLCLELYRDK